MNPEEVAAIENALKIEGDNLSNIEVKLVYNEATNSYELQISDLIGQMAPDTELIIISEVEEPIVASDEQKTITYIDARDLPDLGSTESKKEGDITRARVYTTDNIKHEDISSEDFKEDTSSGRKTSLDQEIDCKPDISDNDLMENSVVIIDNTSGKLSICKSTSIEQDDMSESKILVCEHCAETFPTMAALQKHKVLLHKTLFECEICSKQLSDSQVYKAHMLLHGMKKTFKCEICHKIFTQKGLWNRHQLLHSGKKSSVCEICGKTFAHNGYLQKHQLIHAGNKRFTCEQCGKGFLQGGYLKRHMLVHTGERPYECDICHATFTQKHVLETHALKHTGAKPFVCEICNKAFSRKRTLNKHLAMHIEENGDPNQENSSGEIKVKKEEEDYIPKQYVCEICGKIFLYKGSWKTHKVIHLAEKPYSCDICNKTFSFKGNLKTHKAIHLEDRPYKCGLCKKAFAQSGELKRHLLMHTGEKPYLCDICSKAFSHGSYLKKHKLVHKDEKPFKCECCTKVFSRQGYLKDHMLVHTGEKKFKCECGKAFSRSGYLKRHRVLHTAGQGVDNFTQEM